MPRSHWKGYISFGLVSIPVTLFPTEDNSADIGFHQIDKRNNARIKFQRINSTTGKVVEWKNIVKGYQYDDDTMIPVPEEMLKKISGENGRTIDIQQFIKKSELELITLDRSYFIVPEKKNGDKGYVLLREALMETDKVGIGKVIISTKEYLAAIMPYEEKALVMFLIKYDKEMHDLHALNIPDKSLSAYKVTKKEIDIARQLINSMTAAWQPEKYVDEYQDMIHQWVEEVVNKSPHKAAKRQKTKPVSNVIDFASLLKKSLQASKHKVVAPKKAKTKKARKLKKGA